FARPLAAPARGGGPGDARRSGPRLRLPEQQCGRPGAPVRHALSAIATKGTIMAIPDTMTATVLVAPHRFELQQRPVPDPGDEDVLVRVRACGICGTDLKIIHTGMPMMPPYAEFI